MIALLIRLVVNAVAIWAAAEIVPGVGLTEDPLGLVLVALVFGIVNAAIKPVLLFVGLPFIVVTLGLFTLVINAGLLALTAWVTPALSVTGFWPALLGAVVVSIVSWFLGLFVGTSEADAGGFGG